LSTDAVVLRSNVGNLIHKSKLASRIIVLATFWAATPVAILAQCAEGPVDDATSTSFLPDAAFGATFRKYVPPQTVFSPFYSWDADLSLDLAIVRRGRDALKFSSQFQTAGTRNLGSKVGVGGTGYLLGLRYVHAWSADVSLSSGLLHFSSHLTRDLDDKIDEERRRGNLIPLVDDPSEFNVVYIKGRWSLPRIRFAPELEVAVQPINFRFDGGQADYVRPVYLATRWTFWQSDRRSLTAETQQELGEHPFLNVVLLFAVYARAQPERRLQIFVSGSPGANVHVSPQIGAFRNGIAVGFRLSLRS